MRWDDLANNEERCGAMQMTFYTQRFIQKFHSKLFWMNKIRRCFYFLIWNCRWNRLSFRLLLDFLSRNKKKNMTSVHMHWIVSIEHHSQTFFFLFCFIIWWEPVRLVFRIYGNASKCVWCITSVAIKCRSVDSMVKFVLDVISYLIILNVLLNIAACV